MKTNEKVKNAKNEKNGKKAVEALAVTESLKTERPGSHNAPVCGNKRSFSMFSNPL